MVPRKSVREHGAIAEAGREYTRGVNTEAAFEHSQKFVKEDVVVLVPRSLVSVAFRSNENCSFVLVKRFQAIVAFILHATGPAAHALHTENELVRFVLVVALRDIDAHGARSLAPLEFEVGLVTAILIVELGSILAATTSRNRIVLESPTVCVLLLDNLLLERERDVSIQIGERDRQCVVIGRNHAELVTFAFLGKAAGNRFAKRRPVITVRRKAERTLGATHAHASEISTLGLDHGLHVKRSRTINGFVQDTGTDSIKNLDADRLVCTLRIRKHTVHHAYVTHRRSCHVDGIGVAIPN